MVIQISELCLIAAGTLTAASSLFTIAGSFGDDWVHVDSNQSFSLTVGMLPSRCSDLPEDESILDKDVNVNDFCDKLRKAITNAVGHKAAALLLPALAADLMAVTLFIIIWWQGIKIRKFILPVCCVLELMACVLTIVEASHILRSVKGNQKLINDMQLTSLSLGWCIDILIVGGVAAGIAVPLTFTSLVTRPAPPISPSEITLRSPTILTQSRKIPLS